MAIRLAALQGHFSKSMKPLFCYGRETEKLCKNYLQFLELVLLLLVLLLVEFSLALVLLRCVVALLVLFELPEDFLF